MIDELLSQGPWPLLLIQGTVCLVVGLAASCALRHRPARAHQALLTGMLASVLMPGLYLSAEHFGLGVLAPKTAPSCSTPAVARASCPCTSDPMGPLGPDKARPGWPRDARAGRPRHDGWAVDMRLLPDLPTADGPTLLTAEPVGEIPALSAATIQVPWSMIAVVCWSAATAILLLRLVLRFLLGWRVVHAAQPLDNEPIRRAMDTAKGRLGVTKPIRIRRSGSVQSPVIWCWSREPVLLVQENASHAENRADWTGVFCHEISHWRRLDHLTGLFTEVLMAAFPWHPLLGWAKDRLLRLSEQACDDWVLATGQNDADYAEMLLGLAAERQMAFLPTTIGKGKTMNLRIRRIITDNGSNPRIGRRWALVVGMLAVGATVGVAVAQPRPAGPEPRDGPPTKVVKERREIEVREPPGADQQRVAMKRVLERLMKQAGEKKEMLREGNDLSEEERQVQQIELKLLTEQIEQMKNRLEAPGREPVKIGPKGPMEAGREARFDSLRQRQEELAQKARSVERELEGLKDGQDQEAREMKDHLEQLRVQRSDVDRQLAELPRAQAGGRRAGARPPQPQAQPENLRQRRAELAEESRLIEQRLGGLRPEQDQEARELQARLQVIRAQMAELDKRPEGLPRVQGRVERAGAAAEPRPRRAPAENPGLEAQVEELRNQMRELREQMQQMQRLLEQAGARGQTRERPGEQR